VIARQRRRRIEELFEAALERAPVERAGWLATACPDAALRAEVEALLDAHELGDAFESALGIASSPAPTPPTAERRIGPYRVLRELGRGGMGVVYLAERDDGTYRRHVAIKLLRGSPDGDELRRRFRAERQILASLAHPSIAQLLDGGVTDGQLPYLVMEYVDGLPITTYCDRNRLTIEQRLRLFQAVCAAVHHAHSNLVLHRDLKPGNIFVTPSGQVKLLDFGIAKLLNPSLGGADQPVTRTAYRVLTPEYASPEQIRGETLTTASDVYALGVILYELLAGRPPYRIATQSPRELADAIEAHEPARPSSRFTRGDGPPAAGGEDAAAPATAPERPAAAIAAARDTTVEALRRTLRGDLDAIALMALRKEPNRRYGSADLLAADLQRHLDGLPVLAHRGSRGYRLGKAVRRHRLVAAAAALVALSLLGGVTVAAWQASIARRAQTHAEAARLEAEQAHQEAQTVATFLLDLFEAGDPLESGDEGITARDLLQRGMARLDQLSGEPLIQASLLDVVARAQRSLGSFADSRAALERALALRRPLLADDDPLVTGTMFQLADALRREERFREAMDLARAAHALRARSTTRDWPDEAEHMVQIAGLLVYFGDLHGADSLMVRALEQRRSRIGTEDTLIAASLERVAATRRRLGDDAAAERFLREAIALRERLVGEHDRTVALLLLRLGDVLATYEERAAAADSAYRRAVTIARAAYPPQHSALLDAEGSYASFASRQGRHQEAETEWRRLASLFAGMHGRDHFSALGAKATLAGVLARAGKYAEAEPLLREVIEVTAQRLGPDHSALAGHYGALSDVLAATARFDEAEAAAREAIRVRRQGMNSAVVGLTITYLADVKRRRGDYPAADSLFQEGIALMKEQVADTHHDMRRIHGRMAELYEAWGRPAEAERYRRLSAVR
jgi:eukaryotic-like serine/threonine-protein kinase